MALVLKNISSYISYIAANKSSIQFQQVRTKFADWRMLKDYKRRQTIKQYGEERLRINIIRKNTILPPELREIGDRDIAAFPRDASITRIVPRCTLTSRPRGVVRNYRVSRIMFRNLADANQLPAVQRAFW